MKFNYCAFDILRKDVFLFCILFKMQILTISYQEPFVVSVLVICFQNFTIKLILWPKNGFDLYNFYIINFFFYFISNYFLLFFTGFKLLMFCENCEKF